MIADEHDRDMDCGVHDIGGSAVRKTELLLAVGKDTGSVSIHISILTVGMYCVKKLLTSARVPG